VNVDLKWTVTKAGLTLDDLPLGKGMPALRGLLQKKRGLLQSGLVAHACKPGYLAGGDLKDFASRPPQAKS
jgi:hypothetical protein